MAEELERVCTVPFRKAWEKPNRTRASQVLKILKKYLSRHFKAVPENVKVSTEVNELLWAHGMKKPPRRRKLLVKKTKEGIVTAFPMQAEKPAPSNKPAAVKKKEEPAPGKPAAPAHAAKPAEKKQPETHAGEKKHEAAKKEKPAEPKKK